MTTAEERIDSLRKIIEFHSWWYYVATEEDKEACRQEWRKQQAEEVNDHC